MYYSRKLFTVICLIALLAFTFSSCTYDDANNPPTDTGLLDAYRGGVLILHEGQFLAGNASLSVVSQDFNKMENNLFSRVNFRPLGDVAQSMAFRGGEAFIVVNNSQKVEVLNRSTVEEIATVESGLSNPRYMAFLNETGFITNWGDGLDANDDYVAVLDMNTYEVTSTIPVAEGPEFILSDGNRLYVAHQGGFSQNDQVSVISGDLSVQTLTVGDVPNSMQLDGQGNLWVLCGGNPAFTGNETAGSLYRIRLSDLSVERQLIFSTTEHPNELQWDGDHLYFQMNGGVYELSTAESASSPSQLFEGINYYGLLVRSGLVYGVDAGDFSSPGLFEVRDLQGDVLHTQEVGVVPSAIYPL
jgi:YVTN family beta-propeller protein